MGISLPATKRVVSQMLPILSPESAQHPYKGRTWTVARLGLAGGEWYNVWKMRGLLGTLLLWSKCGSPIGVGLYRHSPNPHLAVCLVLLGFQFA